MIIDSHCHLDRLDLSSHGGRLENALDLARKNFVEHFLCVCINLENFPKVLEIANKYKDISCSAGIHPSEAEGQKITVNELVKMANDPKVVAIGETGLDYFHCEGNLEWQRSRFRCHIQAAKIVKKPLIIHMRNASEDVLTILQEEHAEEVGGVMHCFTEDWSIAQRALDLNFYIAFSGILTFKKAQILKNTAKLVPIDKIFIETDSPYLAPVPKRSKANEPAYLHYIAEYLAQLRGISFEDIAAQTTKNFYRLFGTVKVNRE